MYEQTEYDQHIIFFPPGHQRVHSSLLSALVFIWCAESAYTFLTNVFLVFHTGIACLGVISVGTDLVPATFPACSLNHWRCWAVCLCSDVLHSSYSSCIRFHQHVTQLLQENPPSTQFSAVPVLVNFTPCYKRFVGAHINDVNVGQSCISSCMWLWPWPGYQPLPLSRCSPRTFVVFCLLWCSGQHLCAWCSSAGHCSLSWGNRRQQLLCQGRQTLKMVSSCFSLQEAQRKAPACFFPHWPHMVTFLFSSFSPMTDCMSHSAYDTVFGQLAQHILSDQTMPMKCNQTFIHTHVGAWNKSQICVIQILCNISLWNKKLFWKKAIRNELLCKKLLL